MNTGPVIHGEEGLEALRGFGCPPPQAGPEGERIVGCESIVINDGIHRRRVTRATFELMGAEPSTRSAEWTSTGWEWFPVDDKPAPAPPPKPGDVVFIVTGVSSAGRSWYAYISEPVLLVAARDDRVWVHVGWEGTLAGALRGKGKPSLQELGADRVFLERSDAAARARALNEAQVVEPRG